MIHLLAGLRRQPPPAPADPLADAERAEAAALAARADADRRATLAEAAVREAEAAAKIEAIKHRAQLQAEERARHAAAKQSRDAEAARVTKVAAGRSKRRDRGDHVRLLLAEHSSRIRRLLVNLGVNTAAGFGQFKFLTEQAGLDVLWAVILAAGLELMAVTVLDYGLDARREKRPFLLAFVLAALLAGLVASMNYSHWSAAPGQQTLASGFALMSLMSPVLWAWYANARHADREAALARDRRAASSSTRAASTSTVPAQSDTEIASFDVLRWLMWFPETFAAKRQAVRLGISDPDVAVDLAVEHLTGKRAARDAKRAAELAAKQQGELPSGGHGRYLPTPDEVTAMSADEKRESACDAYRTARLDGVELTGPAIASAYRMSESWARSRIREVKGAMLHGKVETDDDNQVEGAG
ncbi:hypothetical protein ABT352_22585 [Streptosporangium sp. NPDC000563]|uniref:hypothetical protein n=1 Tax=Streptosporangium sp. NPDC000563 TaxID=3154366 RepID=UPI003323DA19